ncbi:terminase TerL endonuclease subunit [Bacillus thuringiensis]|uniref:terminase TerL endonuclease subunit n=1 Tax=Bacillus thuringiensis TaxID=1428 RepID=UPI0039B3D3F3
MEHLNMNKLLNLKRDIRFEAKGENEYKLTVYGSIGGWFSENNAEAVRRKIQDVKAEKIHVHINSGGGSAFDGVAICNQLKQHNAEIIVHIDGWAASAASVIAMAGDKIIMPSNTMMNGLRDGAVVFDEIHQYESNKDVRVHISGLGKKKNPREFYIGTDGYVRDGFLDKQKEKAMKVLNGEARPNAVFPFICKLNDETEVDDLDNWELANPMLSKPLSEYAEGLLETIKEEYEDLEDDPSNREEFMTKRMNLPVTNLERSVAKWSEILATDRPFPDLQGQECIGSLDFASIRDFAACGLLFRQSGDYLFKTHSFVRKEFVDIYYGYSKKAGEFKKQKFAPIKEWEEQGLLTVVDEPTINPQHIVDWFVKMREQYGVKKIFS